MDPRTDDAARVDLQREEALMRRLFAATGRRQQPDEAAMRRAEETFRSALAPIVQRRKRKRIVMTISIAASLLAAVGLGLLYTHEQPSTNAVPVANLVKTDGPVEVVGGTFSAANTIRTGETLQTGATGRASVSYRGADIRLDVATTVRFDPARLVLERGALYVDTGDARAAGEPPVLIETRFGMLGHTGTRFIVRLDTDHLTVGVRDGTVFVKSSSGRRDLSAQLHRAAVADVDAFGDIRISAAEPYGGMWSWVPETSPGFAADGKSVDSYLGWLGREYGYSIEYGDATARSRAQATLLHGDLNGLAIADAIATVSATTQLVVALDDVGVVRVSSEGDHDTDPRHDRQ